MKGVYRQADWLQGESQEVRSIRKVMDGFVGVFPVPDDVFVQPVECSGVAAEWIVPPEAEEQRTVLYFHGGCYISGSPGVVREFCSRLARASRSKVLCIDYRLAPEHKFPAALDDALDSYRWLLAQGVSSEDIAFAGESAGGGLVLATLVQCRELCVPMPACAVPISPWVDLEVCYGDSLSRNYGVDMAPFEPLLIGAEAYAGNGNRRNPLASPLHADLSHLPPLLVQVGTNELLLDEAVEIANRAQRAGCEVTLQRWEDMTHVWHWYASVFPEAQEAIEEIGTWIQSQTR